MAEKQRYVVEKLHALQSAYREEEQALRALSEEAESLRERLREVILELTAEPAHNKELGNVRKAMTLMRTT